MPDDDPRQLAPCGTYAAARRHYRRGEPLDDACRGASADHNRRRTVVCRDCGTERAAGDGAHGRCGACYQRWRRNGRPADPPRNLKASDSGYGPYGVVRLDVAS